MSDQEILLTTGPGCGTIKEAGADPTGGPKGTFPSHSLAGPSATRGAGEVPVLSDLEICLMLTRVFLGREDSEIAGNLYRLSRLFKANTKTEEEQQDGENRPEA